MIWTPETDEILRAEYGVRSAAAIADSLGASRNSVIGRAHRLGLVSRRTRKASSLRKAAKPRSARTRVRMPSLRPDRTILRAPEIETLNIPFLKIRDGQCKSITDVVGEEGLATCCGHPVSKRDSPSYCREHALIYSRMIYIKA